MFNLSNKLMDVICSAKALRLKTIDVQELLNNVQGIMQVKAQEKHSIGSSIVGSFKIEVMRSVYRGSTI